ncbi:MAG TPA: class I SAM-dependent methyltransferase [Acidimicrobiales bacterium]|nr:class I SAM-dependent methyltransferase [Acidimicrobiales bacterium]
MVHDRDVTAFADRAPGYEQGWLGRMHRDIAERTVDLALSTCPRPRRVLDIGCGTGYLLRSLASRCPGAIALHGVDPAAPMVEVARTSADDDRLHFSSAAAEHLPFVDGTFDLVVSTTSFDHWSDQQAGLGECSRVLVPGGHLVLVDQFSLWLSPTLVITHRGKARTKRRCSRLLRAAGLRRPAWHELYSVIVKAVTATA